MTYSMNTSLGRAAIRPMPASLLLRVQHRRLKNEPCQLVAISVGGKYSWDHNFRILVPLMFFCLSLHVRTRLLVFDPYRTRGTLGA